MITRVEFVPTVNRSIAIETWSSRLVDCAFYRLPDTERVFFAVLIEVMNKHHDGPVYSERETDDVMDS